MADDFARINAKCKLTPFAPGGEFDKDAWMEKNRSK